MKIYTYLHGFLTVRWGSGRGFGILTVEWNIVFLYSSFYFQSSSSIVPIVYFVHTVTIIKISLSLHALYCVLVSYPYSPFTVQFPSYITEIKISYFHLTRWKFIMRITQTFSLCLSEVGTGVDFWFLIFKILKLKNDVGQKSLTISYCRPDRPTRYFEITRTTKRARSILSVYWL